jgi:hypothetical protein
MSPKLFVRPLFVACLAAVLVSTPGALPAQQLRAGLLVGRILAPDGGAVGGAIVRATRGAITYIAQAEDDGDYRVGGLSAGTWTISVRRIGFAPIALDLEMPAGGLRRDITIVPTTPTLDPVLVAARWMGVRGVVGDARRITPLAGASIRVMGSDAWVSSDSLGNFALPLPGGRDIVLRIDRAGFSTRLLSATIPEDGYLTLEVPLDTTPEPQRDYWVWRDLDQRLKYATPRAVQVSRQEIEESDAVSLLVALDGSRSVTRTGVIITRRTCVYVNGVARPGYPVDAIRAGEVEFVEAYPPGTDLTRTLMARWPPGGLCGVAEGSVRSRAGNNRQVAQFVSVWLRAP